MADEQNDPASQAARIWADALAVLGHNASLTPRDRGWLEGVIPEAVFGTTIVLCVANSSTQQALQNDLNEPLLAALHMVSGQHMFPAFKIVPPSEPAPASAATASPNEGQPAPTQPSQAQTSEHRSADHSAGHVSATPDDTLTGIRHDYDSYASHSPAGSGSSVIAADVRHFGSRRLPHADAGQARRQTDLTHSGRQHCQRLSTLSTIGTACATCARTTTTDSSCPATRRIMSISIVQRLTRRPI
jgi:hypothetical protein